MDEVQIVEAIEQETPAFTLEAGNAVGESSETRVSWQELREAPIGTEWGASGGGSMFGMEDCATLIYRDERIALIHFWGQYNDANGRRENHSYLKAYEWIA